MMICLKHQKNNAGYGKPKLKVKIQLLLVKIDQCLVMMGDLIQLIIVIKF